MKSKEYPAFPICIYFLFALVKCGNKSEMEVEKDISKTKVL